MPSREQGKDSAVRVSTQCRPLQPLLHPTRLRTCCGRPTLWLPGTDHAGIATQSVVEKAILRDEGKTRQDIGRDEFVRRAWEWTSKYGDSICSQLRRMGVSADWSRQVFTLDPHMCEAVTEAFVRMAEQGLIYRATRLVAWCPHLKTALSDVEVDFDEIDGPTRTRIPGFDKTVEVGVLCHFKYEVLDMPHTFITVATTRLETMLGDVAVAVHPDDARYKSLVGKKLKHPFLADRELTVIADAYVDPAFGTGAVKITPAHDKNDYEIGKRHDLPMITILTLDGRMAANCGEFAGQHRFQARATVEQRLTELELFVEKTPNPKMQIPRCSRSNDIIEYMVLPQWWAKMNDAATYAVDVVESGDLKLVPETYKSTWNYFLANIRDWCISRQLWWGHRIPAWRICVKNDGGVYEPYFDAKGKDTWIVARSEEEAQKKVGELIEKLSTSSETTMTSDAEWYKKEWKLIQDEDVVDTWFSASLFPFAPFGWPNKIDSDEFRAFYPGSVLETGHDILFFWVARMVMMSKILLNSLPFHTVYLHPIIRDSHGKKMSKSLGNVIDPISVVEGISLKNMEANIRDSNLSEKEILRAIDAQKKDFPEGIPECGVDGLRYGLMSYLRQGRSINLEVNKLVSYRFFCNKLWNAVRFSLSYLKTALAMSPSFLVSFSKQHPSTYMSNLSWTDKWILHCLHQTVSVVNDSFKTYNLETCVSATYNFWLYQFCDVYLETLKPRLQGLTKDSGAEKLTGDSDAEVAIVTPPVNSKSELSIDQQMALSVLFTSIETGLRLLHPMMPFVTEELWQKVVVIDSTNQNPVSISISQYPEASLGWIENQTIDFQHKMFSETIHHFRSLISTLDINPKEASKLDGEIRVTDSTNDSCNSCGFLSSLVVEIAALSKISRIKIVTEFSKGVIHDVANSYVSIALDPQGSVNFEQVTQKLTKKKLASEKMIENIIKKQTDPNYKNKVPEDVQVDVLDFQFESS